MVSYKLSLLSRSCLLALTTGSLPVVALAESPWKASGGNTVEVTSGYTSATLLDYPLFATGAGSLLESTVNGLSFRTTGDNLFAANATAGGAIHLNGAALSTNGAQAHGANVIAGELALTGGNITVAGQNSYGVFGSNGAVVSLADLAIAADGAMSSGVTLSTGTLNASNVSILATGDDSQGMNLAYSNLGNVVATLDNVNIILRGAGTQAGLMLGNGQVEGKNVTLSSSGNNRGVDVYNTEGSGRGTLTLTDSTITTQNGDAVYILGGDVTLNNATVNSNNGQGINVNSRSSAALNGGSVTTQGNGADALWIASSTSSATAENTAFTTHGYNAIAFNAQYGPATVKNSVLTTDGIAGHGLYSESQVQGNNLTINTKGNNAMGVYASNGGTINLDTASVATTGDTASGMLAYLGSTITGNEITLTTTGADSHALWAGDGIFALSNSNLSTTGANANGLQVSSTKMATGSSVTLDHTVLATEKATAIRVLGTGLTLALKNGTQVTGGNGVLLENIAGDTSNPNYHGDVVLTADNQVVLNGDIRSSTQSRMTAALTNASQLNGAVNNVSELSLDNSSIWNMTGNSLLGEFNHDGVVNFRHNGANFNTLTMDTLSGNGGFNMNTDLASLKGDLVVVNGNASGDHWLGIKNSGREPGKSSDVLTVVQTGGGTASFSLNGGAVDAGTYQYVLQHQGDNWVLAQKQKDVPPTPTPDPDPTPTPDPTPDPVPTPTTVAALGMFNATPTVWYGELTTLRTRMGEVREGKKEGGAWARVLGNQYNVNDRAGVGYQQTQSGISVGVDSAHDMEEGQYLTGLFSGYSQNKLDFASDSTGTINSFFIGAYGTWLLADGWYVDALAKANNFSNSADVRMTDGEKTRGGYSTLGLGFSLEAGRQFLFEKGWFAEPSVQVSSLWVNGQSYSYDNGLQAESGQATSQQAALNGTVGRSMMLENGMMLQPWVRAALIQEFSDNNPVSINGNGFTNDMSGLRAEYGAGVAAQLTKDVQTYLDARYSKGDKIESPWGANLGVRWTW